jgi:hypothetical protein
MDSLALDPRPFSNHHAKQVSQTTADFLIGFSLKGKWQPEPGLDGSRGHNSGRVL